MISTIDDTIVNTGGKDKETNLEIKKPYAVVQYNKWMKRTDTADQYLGCCSVLRKTVKWLKASAKLCSPRCIFVYKTLTQKWKYKNFLHQVARSWISEGQNLSPILMKCSHQSSNQHQGGLIRTPQADCLGISANTDWTIVLLVERARSILQKSVNCKLHIRSEVKLDTFVNFTLFHFTGVLVLRNTNRNCLTLHMQYLQSWVQDYYLDRQIVSKNIRRGWT